LSWFDDNKMVNKEEQIGIHKGALSVLAIEQQEFVKLLNIIQSQIDAHVKALKELGVDLEAEAKKVAEAQKEKKGSSEDLMDRLN
jgi:hypothetical protein